MKKFCKKMLNRKTKKYNPHEPIRINNAINAEKQIGIPYSLWMEYSDALFGSEIYPSIKKQLPSIVGDNTLFLLGFALGYAEKQENIK